MDLRHASAAIRHWRLVMALLLLGCLGAAGAYAALAPREYTSTTTVFFALNRTPDVSGLAQGNTYTQDAVRSYSEIVTLPVVLDPVIQQLGLRETATQLARKITVSTQPDTVLARISVVDDDPRRAAQIADAVRNQLSQAVRTLAPGGVNSPGAIRVDQLSAADVPTAPTSPNVPLVLALGLVGGLVLAVGAAVLLELASSPLVTPQTAEGAAPVVGKIIHDSKARAHPLPVSTHPHLARAESFQVLRTNLRRLDGEDTPRTLVVTSCLAREGRTGVAVNLAIAVSHSFRSVLLIDADLRRPTVAQTLLLDGSVGLADVLAGEANLDDVTQMWQTQTWRDSTLHVLAAGGRALDSSGLLARSSMTDLIADAREKYDLVIMDSPPLLPVTDAALLAAQTDGALLVVRSQSTREREFAEGISALSLAGARLRGVVFNGVRVPRRQLSGPRNYAPSTHTWKR